MLLRLFVVLLSLFAVPLSAVVTGDLDRIVSSMAKIGYSTAPSFSPDGSRVAFLSNMSGSPQLWIVSSEGGWPEMVTGFDDPVTALRWSPDGRWIALTVAPGGGLNEQVYLLSPDGALQRMITAGGETNNWLGPWSPDGKLLAFGSSQRDPAAIDAWIYDLVTGEPRLVARNEGIGTVSDISADGKYALLSRVIGRGDNNIYRVKLENGEETLLTPHTGSGSFEGAFGADPDTVYLVSNYETDLQELARVRLADGKPGPIERLRSRKDAELDGIEVNDAGTFAILGWNVAGRSELEVLDLQKMTATAAPRLPGDVVSALDIAKDGSRAAVVISGATRPTDVWMWDLSKNTLRQLTRSPHAGVDLKKLIGPELVRYQAHDGEPLSGWLYKPRGASGKLPVVVSFHGGPESQERPGLNSTYQGLLAAGIAVFAPNVRGSSGFGKRFVNLDNGALRVNAVRDIKATVDHLVAAGIADPKRLGIMGGSYGGYMVMAGLTEYPDMFAAGANLFGVVNFETFFKHTQPWMAAISTTEYGDPAKEPELMRSLSPFNRIDRVKSATLVLHGANDTNVPVIEAEQIVENLKSRKVPVEYVLFPDEGHGWRRTPNRIRSATTIVRFFSQHLRGS